MSDQRLKLIFVYADVEYDLNISQM